MMLTKIENITSAIANFTRIEFTSQVNYRFILNQEEKQTYLVNTSTLCVEISTRRTSQTRL